MLTRTVEQKRKNKPKNQCLNKKGKIEDSKDEMQRGKV